MTQSRKRFRGRQASIRSDVLQPVFVVRPTRWDGVFAEHSGLILGLRHSNSLARETSIECEANQSYAFGVANELTAGLLT